MTAQPPPGTVFMTRLGTTWHNDLHCTALDSARLNEGGHVLTEAAERAASRRPCIVCAAAPATEWTVASDTIGELLELVGPSKPHWAPDETGALDVDGLTIRAHNDQPRTVARYGDTITRQPDGTWTVKHVEETTQ